MAEGAMSTFLTNIGTFFTQAISWLGNVLTTITENPALTVMVLAMPIVGFAVDKLAARICKGACKPRENGGNLFETIPC